MTPEELEAGYAWIYRRLFSLPSIWRRRPARQRPSLPYLGMALLYKRSNSLWKLLIRHRLTHAVWDPLVELTRRRHLRYRARLAPRPRSRARSAAVAPQRLTAPAGIEVAVS